MNREVPEFHPVIRRLWRIDQSRVRGHFLRLDYDSRHLRFGGPVNDAGINKYVDGFFAPGVVAYGAFVDGELRALAELRRDIIRRQAPAEMAFSVEAECQNHGIGDALFRQMVAVARNRGIKKLLLHCLSNNIRMRHLALKHEADLEFGFGEVEGTLSAPWPSFVSVFQEMVAENRALLDAVLHWPARVAKP
ncbi:GNAT family N-acetyltransferase [Amaricoccus tamworthensis]|uniref:GNAT family N-acetyltransferase n=1 Tax=Amaricoccus tamworthensis TaxID=57002 RepID=UPI003C7C93F0